MAKERTSKAAASSQQAPKNPFVGRWRITWMELWDQKFVDEEVEGFFEFELGGHGPFQFGYVRGQIDYRLLTCDGKSRLEFSWDGFDELDPAQGRGWAIADGEHIDGMLFFHLGDESKFKAERRASTKSPRRNRLCWTNLGSN